MIRVDFKELSGNRLKKDADLGRAVKRYHNKHVDKSGNFGYTLISHRGEWFTLHGRYDSKGEIKSVDFWTYSGSERYGVPLEYGGLIKVVREVVNGLDQSEIEALEKELLT